MSVDLKNLSKRQEVVLQQILSVCEYFEASRQWNLEDRILAEQAKRIGSLMADLKKDEKEQKR